MAQQLSLDLECRRVRAVVAVVTVVAIAIVPRPQKVSSVTVLELYEGVARLQAPETKRERILDVLETKHVVSADQAVMRKAGKLSGELINGGKQSEREDCIIAATALLNDEPIITRNTKHFNSVDDLEVRSH